MRMVTMSELDIKIIEAKLLRARADMEGMIAENAQRKILDEGPAYHADSFHMICIEMDDLIKSIQAQKVSHTHALPRDPSQRIKDIIGKD